MDDDAKELLKEIRDLQRQHLDEYRKASARAIALQETAVERQKQVVTLYQRVIVGTLVIVLCIVALIASLLL